jgi:hypothetical protein
MKIWAIALVSVVLNAASSNVASAQGVFGSIFGSPASWFDPKTEFPEPKAFGTQLTQLPGQRVTAAPKIKGKWLQRQVKRNVELDHVRVPQLLTSLLLDLQADGSYTLDYQAYWGGAGNTEDSRHATLDAHEVGRFSVSGSVLLLEAAAVEVTQEGKLGRSQQHSDNERHAYLIRLDKSYLNIAGPCARYQAEDVCKRNRSVWFSLLQLQAAQLPKR